MKKAFFFFYLKEKNPMMKPAIKCNAKTKEKNMPQGKGCLKE